MQEPIADFTYSPGLVVRDFTTALFAQHRHEIDRIEASCYEAARRDSAMALHGISLLPGAIALAAFDLGTMVGYCIAAPLEHFAHTPGPREDRECGNASTLYCADTTVDPSFRRQGVGKTLKAVQIDRARAAGYRYLSGRNRRSLGDAMMSLNHALGATVLFDVPNAYCDDIRPNDAAYYRIALQRSVATSILS